MGFTGNAQSLIEQVENQIENNMYHLTLQYKSDLQDTLDVPPARSGRVYRWVKGKRLHVASAPGEPPAPLTSELIASIDHTVEATQGSVFRSYVYSDKEYAVYLELGTVHIEPRPAWEKTVDENREEYASLATEGFTRGSGL